LLSLMLSPDTTQDVSAYFGLLGLIGWALGMTAIAAAVVTMAGRVRRDVLRLGAILGVAIVLVAGMWFAAPVIAAAVLLQVVHQPRSFVVIGLLSAIATFLVTRHRRRQTIVAAPALVTCAVVALCSAPLAGLGRPNDERVSVLQRWRQARTSPSVTDWRAYYPVLRQTMRPPVPVPFAVIESLKHVMPPRQVLLSNPDYSCSLAALLDAYCVNPVKVYGHYFLSGERYLLDYTHRMPNGESDWHPFFNEDWPAEPRESKIISDLRIDYLLADPAHADLMDRKLRALQAPVEVAQRVDGFVLYRIRR
jgi:hypothetical protein